LIGGSKTDEKRYGTLRVFHLKFIGKILSLFTHQLNNHLAIIKDSVGFLEDLVKLRAMSQEDTNEIKETVSALEEEIGKATVLSKKLNSFGHRMDHAFSKFHINDLLEELLVLLSRATTEKRLKFIKEFSSDLNPLFGDPASIQFFMFCLIERFIRALPQMGALTVKTTPKNGSFRIELIPHGDGLMEVPEAFCTEEAIEFARESLGCSISYDPATKGVSVEFLGG
jgi:C4-dicarboxylate-specific signal transduction histidine kinase